MPVTLKVDQMQVKQSDGTYVPILAASDMDTEVENAVDKWFENHPDAITVEDKSITEAKLSDELVAKINSKGSGGEGLTEEAKQALLACFRKVAYIDANGETYYQALYNALYATPKTLVSINAVYVQRGTVYTTDTLDSLRSGLTVTALYSDDTTVVVTDYGLTGTLTAGISSVTATYNGKTSTFSVNVTAVTGTYTITSNLTGCTGSNSATTIEEGGAYINELTANAGYTLTGAEISVTMGGATVTGAYLNGTISIPEVTGNVVITVTAATRTVTAINAVFNQGDNIVHDTDSLNSLKQYLVVTASYSDGGTATVPSTEYTLTGTLTEGTSRISASYGGMYAYFDVVVTSNSALGVLGTKKSGWPTYTDNGDGTYSITPTPTNFTPNPSSPYFTLMQVSDIKGGTLTIEMDNTYVSGSAGLFMIASRDKGMTDVIGTWGSSATWDTEYSFANGTQEVTPTTLVSKGFASIQLLAGAYTWIWVRGSLCMGDDTSGTVGSKHRAIVNGHITFTIS